MKRIFSIAAIGILALTSCKKSSTDTNNNNNTPAQNSWTLGTVQYSTVYTMQLNGSTGGATTHGVMAMDAIPSGSNPNVNNVAVYFATYPTASGTYRVVQYPGANALTAGQVGIVAANGPSGTYTSTGAGAVDVSVTVSGGKVTVTMPQAPLKHTSSTTELVVSGTIKEM